MGSEPSTVSGPDDGMSVLSWLHLSDIHVGEGNASTYGDQRGILRDLLRDIRTPPRGTPKPDVIFVTGDIAFSGNDKIRAGDDRSREYESSVLWVPEILATVFRKFWPLPSVDLSLLSSRRQG